MELSRLYWTGRSMLLSSTRPCFFIMRCTMHDGKGRVAVVGNTFHKEDYGIVFQSNSPLRKQVNGALLVLREDGTYQQIYDKWFGSR
jgi:polar amino acid transport system substrate-binding protein